ncbi:hypothetical protein QT970_03500 [Microcoleus sp. herbarium8]|uniref:hypothetical protein n=1 Tax=Microcoleus sp. herbarium8 TaxID=3055436 RepID=UPI002FD26C0F
MSQKPSNTKRDKMPGSDALPIAGAAAFVVVLLEYSALQKSAAVGIAIAKPFLWVGRSLDIMTENVTTNQIIISAMIGFISFLVMIGPLYRGMRRLDINSMATKQRKIDKINEEVLAAKQKQAKVTAETTSSTLINKFK